MYRQTHFMASQSPRSLLHEVKDKMQVKSNMVANSLFFICYIFYGFNAPKITLFS